jgi:hypothetical protein
MTDAVLCVCGHPWAEHDQVFGCRETFLAADGETWLGCACDRGGDDDR